MASSNHRKRGYVRGARPPKRKLSDAVTLVRLDAVAFPSIFPEGFHLIRVDPRDRAPSRVMTIRTTSEDDALRGIVRKLNLELRRGLALLECAGLLALADWVETHGNDYMRERLTHAAKHYGGARPPAKRGQSKSRPAPRRGRS